MFLAVLLLLVIQERLSLGYLPVNTAKVAGESLLLSCEAHSGDSFVLWKFQPIGSHEAEILFNGYNISKDRPGFFISSSRPGQFNLANNMTRLEDAGTYLCVQRNVEQWAYRTETGVARLAVLMSAPNCGSNASSLGVVEGDEVRMWCSVNYSGKLDPVMGWSTDDGSIVESNVSYVRASNPYTLSITASEIMAPSDHNVTYICKTYFKAPATVQDKIDTFTARNAPDYRDECKLTINVLFGPRNLSINPRKNSYVKGDRIRCSASGNPTPTFSWKGAEAEDATHEPLLTVDDAMEQRRTNTYRCIAENTIAGVKKITSETITFNVADTLTDLSSGRSLIVIVGAAAAFGGIVVTAVGVMLWRLSKRKCNIETKENESIETRGSPHDYDSVKSGDMESSEQTPDMEMDQTSIMANETMDQSITEAEEVLAVTETLRYYDTLDGCQTVPVLRPYSSLETPRPEDYDNHAINQTGKSNDYYNVDMNIVVSEQDIHSN